MPRTVPLEACPLCGEGASEEMWTLPDRLYGVPGEYRYVRCATCGSVYQSPRVRSGDLHLCYPSGYYTHAGEAADTQAPAARSAGGVDADERDAGSAAATDDGLRVLRDRVRSWIRWAVQGDVRGDDHSRRVEAPGFGNDGLRDDGLRDDGVGGGGVGGGANPRPGLAGRLLGRALAGSRRLRERAFFGLIDSVVPRSGEPGRALEIGAGSGWELGLLQRVGWQAEGVELDPAAAAAARDDGLRVRVGDFLEVVGDDETYDLIYLSHVFEHLAELEEAFRFFGRHLRPGGRTIIRFPNLHSLGVRAWGRHWQGWDPPRHLVLPSHEGIRALARRAGLSGVRLRIETRARDAGFVPASSRAIEERFGESDRPSPSDPLKPTRRLGDHLTGGVEAVLVALGLPLGEETVVVLEVPELVSEVVA